MVDTGELCEGSGTEPVDNPGGTALANGRTAGLCSVCEQVVAVEDRELVNHPQVPVP